jgi:hypothetical protein
MTLPASSQPEQAGRNTNTLLSFLAYLGVMLGAYIVLRKSVGIIPALITVYLLYVYRNDVGESLQGIINGRA